MYGTIIKDAYSKQHTQDIVLALDELYVILMILMDGLRLVYIPFGIIILENYFILA